MKYSTYSERVLDIIWEKHREFVEAHEDWFADCVGECAEYISALYDKRYSEQEAVENLIEKRKLLDVNKIQLKLDFKRRNKMYNIPKKIYLCIGDEIDIKAYGIDDFDELDEITWCSGVQLSNDIEYILKTEVDKLVTSAVKKEREKCLKLN